MSGGEPIYRGGSLRNQLSGAWTNAAVGIATRSASLEPSLRTALSQAYQPGPSTTLSFAARASIDSDDPQASLEMFRRMSTSRRERPSGDGGKPPRVRTSNTGSAHVTETDASSPHSQSSLLDLLDEGWSGLGAPPAPPQQQPRHEKQQPAFARASLSSGGNSPSLPPLVLPPAGGSPGDPHAPLPSASSAATNDTAFFSWGRGGVVTRAGGSVTGESDAPLLSGMDTPRSAVSWTSALSSLTMPQSDAELQQLDLTDEERERLAVEVADLQAKAAVSMRVLSQQRIKALQSGARALQSGATVTLQVSPATATDGGRAGHEKLGGGGGSAGGKTTDGRSGGGEGASAGPVALLLQLYLLVLAVAECALAWWAGVVNGVSCGLLELPRSLAVAPVTALRAVVCLLLALGEAVAVAVGGTAPRAASMHAR